MFCKYWLPVLGWMGFIFVASTDALASRHTSRILGPLLRWLIPGLSEAAIGQVQFLARKAGHVCEYAILALLLWRALRPAKPSVPASWSWTRAQMALGLSAVYAMTDEMHQAFTVLRQASGWDVLLDSAGAALGLAALWLAGRWRKRW
jgi:VanZ family protein